MWSNTGVRVLYVGGNYNANDSYGVFYFNANNDATNSNGNLGSRHLVYNPFIARVSGQRPGIAAAHTVALAKNSTVQDGV